VAEGVETQEQLQFLATHGCTLAQGFFIARPVEASEMEKMLRIGSDGPAVISLPAPKASVDVPLADYEAEMLLQVAKK
jgi:predicted signal transduction protein with EAL and GGDEF domain